MNASSEILLWKGFLSCLVFIVITISLLSAVLTWSDFLGSLSKLSDTQKGMCTEWIGGPRLAALPNNATSYPHLPIVLIEHPGRVSYPSNGWLVIQSNMHSNVSPLCLPRIGSMKYGKG